jgi:hypothetical protein
VALVADARGALARAVACQIMELVRPVSLPGPADRLGKPARDNGPMVSEPSRGINWGRWSATRGWLTKNSPAAVPARVGLAVV